MRAFCILGKFAVLEGDAPGEAVWASAGCKCVQSDPGEGLQDVLRQPVKVVPIAGER